MRIDRLLPTPRGRPPGVGLGNHQAVVATRHPAQRQTRLNQHLGHPRTIHNNTIPARLGQVKITTLTQQRRPCGRYHGATRDTLAGATRDLAHKGVLKRGVGVVNPMVVKHQQTPTA